MSSSIKICPRCGGQLGRYDEEGDRVCVACGYVQVLRPPSPRTWTERTVHIRFRDGCYVAPSCLNCPLPRCVHDPAGTAGARLFARDRRRGRVVKLRDGGMGVFAIARELGVSPRTVHRDLKALAGLVLPALAGQARLTFDSTKSIVSREGASWVSSDSDVARARAS